MKVPGTRKTKARSLTDDQELVIWAQRLESALVALRLRFNPIYRYARACYRADFDLAATYREDCGKALFPSRKTKKNTPEFMQLCVNAYAAAPKGTRQETLKSMGITHADILRFRAKLKDTQHPKVKKLRQKLLKNGTIPRPEDVIEAEEDFIERLVKQKTRDRSLLYSIQKNTKAAQEQALRLQEATKALYRYTLPHVDQEKQYLTINHAAYELDVDDSDDF
jgi:hypothetical protein